MAGSGIRGLAEKSILWGIPSSSTSSRRSLRNWPLEPCSILPHFTLTKESRSGRLLKKNRFNKMCIAYVFVYVSFPSFSSSNVFFFAHETTHYKL
uniref:Uncharacterized protein n=1 Tax=Romanomermis culicivorax TaxID=13658 RepID=A0A915HMH1_ROMCU